MVRSSKRLTAGQGLRAGVKRGIASARQRPCLQRLSPCLSLLSILTGGGRSLEGLRRIHNDSVLCRFLPSSENTSPPPAWDCRLGFHAKTKRVPPGTLLSLPLSYFVVHQPSAVH